MRVILDSFSIMNGDKKIDEFTYSRRGNVYEIFNKSSNLFSDDSYTESKKEWDKISEAAKEFSEIGLNIVWK